MALAFAAALCLTCGVANAQGVKGRIDAVTVYRGQAEVVRVAPLPDQAGALEVVVVDLPEQTVPDSLFGDGGEGVRIRAVRFRTQAVEEAPREEVRKLDQQIEAVEKTIRQTQANQSVVARKQEYLDKMEGFVAPTAQVELQKGILDADTLKQITVFSFQQREELAKSLLALQEKQRELNEQATLLRRQRDSLTPGASRTTREAVIFVEKAKKGAADMRLGYIVRGVEWTPSYNVRATTAKADCELEYNASIQQMSGEDWNDVTITLSTATPTLASDSPGLAPFWVSVGPPSAREPYDIFANEKKRQAAEEQFRVSQSREMRQQAEVDVNFASNVGQALLFQGKARWGKAQEPFGEPAGKAPAVTYPISGRQSIKSRSDRQTIQIAALTLPAETYRQAVPTLTRYVYKQALVTNKSTNVLLEGRVNAYLDGQFTGTGTIPLARPGQRFMAGFGVDTQITARQHLQDRVERVVGGNKEQTYVYQLLLENYGDQPVKVRVLDRLPVAKDAAVRVELTQPGIPLSEDELYKKFQHPHNILRWDVEVPAGATEAKAYTIEYKFKLEFDKNLQITPVGPEAYQLEEMEQYMLRRAY